MTFVRETLQLAKHIWAGLLCGLRNFISNPVTLTWRICSLRKIFEKLVYLVDQIPFSPSLVALLSIWGRSRKNSYGSRTNNLTNFIKRRFGFSLTGIIGATALSEVYQQPQGVMKSKSGRDPAGDLL